MATFATRPIQPAYRRDGYKFVNYPLASGADFLAGCPVTLAVTGEVNECTAASATSRVTTIAGFAIAGVADYAWKDDTFGTVDPSVPIALADQEFRGTLKGTFAAADVGEVFGLKEQAGTPGIWTVERALTATSGTSGEDQTSVRIVGVDDEVAVADVDVPVRFVVLSAQAQVI